MALNQGSWKGEARLEEADQRSGKEGEHTKPGDERWERLRSMPSESAVTIEEEQWCDTSMGNEPLAAACIDTLLTRV